MRRLTALCSAALVLALGYATTAPGQLGEAARMPMADLLPLAGGPEVGGTAGEGVLEQALRKAQRKASVVPRGDGPHLGAQVVRRTALRSSPGGEIVVD